MVYIIYNLSVVLKMYRVWLRGKLSKKTWRQVVLMKEIKSLPKKMSARLVFFLSIILFKCVLWLGNIFVYLVGRKQCYCVKSWEGSSLPPPLPPLLAIYLFIYLLEAKACLCPRLTSNLWQSSAPAFQLLAKPYNLYRVLIPCMPLEWL